MNQSPPPESLPQNRRDLTEDDAILLQRAVERLVRFGQQVGVTPEDMIAVLDSGLSVRELLAFLATKTLGAA
jgi:hypothetical protein